MNPRLFWISKTIPHPDGQTPVFGEWAHAGSRGGPWMWGEGTSDDDWLGDFFDLGSLAVDGDVLFAATAEGVDPHGVLAGH